MGDLKQSYKLMLSFSLSCSDNDSINSGGAGNLWPFTPTIVVHPLHTSISHHFSVISSDHDWKFFLFYGSGEKGGKMDVITAHWLWDVLTRHWGELWVLTNASFGVERRDNGFHLVVPAFFLWFVTELGCHPFDCTIVGLSWISSQSWIHIVALQALKY